LRVINRFNFFRATTTPHGRPTPRWDSNPGPLFHRKIIFDC